VLGVMNDVHGHVEAYVDEELWRAEAIQCHPLENTSTLVMSPGAIERALASIGRKVSVIVVPAVVTHDDDAKP
jgi:Ala-tRNA(Pro) deacylase